MKKVFFAGFIIMSVFVSCSSNKRSAVSTATAFNIILIVADDLGRSDLGCYGNTFIETPHLNKMASEGIRFTNAYAAAPLCSPSRASIISGYNPARINLTEHLHGYSAPSPSQKLAPPRIINGLPQDLITIPEALKQEGYVTAHFGKWHLGNGLSAPANNGFDVAYGGGEEGLPKSFFYPFFYGQPYKDLLNDTKEGDYLDDALTSKAIEYISKNRNSKFFIELNFYAPHVPIEGKPGLVKKYNQKRQQTGYKGLPEDEYAAMVEGIDYNVGRMIQFLKESGLDKNTMLLFTSDNGGLDVQEVPAFAKHTPPTSNAPLRGGKGYLYEGGIREPWIVWMPSLVKKGRDETAIVSTDDIFNTIRDLTGAKPISPDGLSFAPLIYGGKREARDYFVHFPHYSPQKGKPGAVMRRGDYKLIEWYENAAIELFNLSEDEGEMNNIATQHPLIVEEMKKALESWRNGVGAKMPFANPGFKPGK